MKRILGLAVLASTLALAPFAAAAESGYVDLGKFTPAEGGQFVEVNLGAPLLKFASVFVDKEEPAVAEMMRNLKHVRVNVVGFNDDTRADTTTRVRALRQELSKQGWTQIVTVQEPGKAEDVAVFVKLNNEESIDGVVVTVLDGQQAVVVNVVGSIKPEQIAALGERFNVPALADLKLQPARKAKGA